MAYGFDSEMLQDSAHMPVINTGLAAGLGLKFMLDHTSRYLTGGDVLVMAPEYHHFYGNIAYGNADLARLFLADPSIAGEFTAKQYKALAFGMENILKDTFFILKNILNNLLGELSPFPAAGNDRRTVAGFNACGDFVAHRTMPARPYGRLSPAELEAVNAKFLDYCAGAVAALEGRGVRVIIIPPSLAETSYRNIEERLVPLLAELEKRNLGFAIPPHDAVFADSLFFDAHYHLGAEGVRRRTGRLIQLLKPTGAQDAPANRPAP